MASRKNAARHRRLGEARQLALLDVVPGRGSDADHGPFAIADAVVIRDLLDPDMSPSAWGGRNYFDWCDSEDGPDWNEGTNSQWHEYLVFCATLRSLFHHATEIARREIRIAGIAPSWHEHGVVITSDQIEHTYHCLFCDYDITTLPAGKGGFVGATVSKRIDNHVKPCAMRFLMNLTTRHEHQLGGLAAAGSTTDRSTP